MWRGATEGKVTEQVMDAFSVVSDGPEDTARIASALARRLTPGDAVLLNGDLAAGKTTFVKAVAAALESPDVVTSPTFTLAQFYATSQVPLLHIDTYRLDGIEEYRDLGLSEYQDDSVSLIEWGDKVAADFPGHLNVRFERLADDGADPDVLADLRTITFSSSSPRWTALLDGLAADISQEVS
jgi:tRNA threonylcarbamoyladenosine biosynthesis protein TsaE